MDSLKPMLLTSLKSYDKSQFFKDVTAGIIVAIIALPLSIALALASGVGPEASIFTAIVAGFVEIIGEENFRPNISAALKHAEDIIAVL